MTFEIRKGSNVIGLTELEFGDPPMGFVYGEFKPTTFYQRNDSMTELALFKRDGSLHIHTKFITIVDSSGQIDEKLTEVTILIESAEEYERYFYHHLEKYNNNFGCVD
ncbi:hypothetical protein ABEG91_20380 [Pantoea agglomerans]|uniref:hypothetical protein n=1 Tax=Enterobacter agglomerans TaxID=549 RepID=UPI003209421C